MIRKGVTMAQNKLSRYKQQKIKKAQEEGAFSDVAISHTSKEKIMKAVKKNDETPPRGSKRQ
ncbi:hypothetical protein [Bdellovibrio sp. NC01]|uniref:hypothetical protein n=1 Tax=Bdellovibrio sp. NC01 TaxID=2220073 RepID=UPI001159A93A|nr:hypothetical protein [Bdellovibrio sp. NC01]